MARLAKLVIPGMPHHVTQRGNRRDFPAVAMYLVGCAYSGRVT